MAADSTLKIIIETAYRANDLPLPPEEVIERAVDAAVLVAHDELPCRRRQAMINAIAGVLESDA